MNKIINRRTIPYLLLLPTAIFFAIFWLVPVVKLVLISFQTPGGVFTLQNYVKAFTDSLFLPALWNTALFTCIGVVLDSILALFLAILINKKFKGAGVLLFIAMIPMVLPGVAIGAIWKTGFADYGWINSLLCHIGILDPAGYPPSWLNCGWLGMLSLIILIDIWTVVPGTMIILLAGLQNIPEEAKEAGYSFGASKFTVLRKITIPMMKSTIVTAVIFRLISAVMVWMIIIILFNFSRFPVLVERIVYYADKAIGLPDAEQMTATYTIVVTVIVTVISLVFLKMTGAIGKKKKGLPS